MKFTMAAGAVSFLRPLNVFAGMEPNVVVNTLTILHTSNLKGQWQPIGQNEKLYGLGGLQNLGRKIREIKNNTASSVLIHAGDIVDTRSQKKADCLHFYKALGKAGYDVVIPGKSDLAKSKNYFKEMAQQSGLPSFSCELQNPDAAFLPYYVINKGFIKVGIINAASGVNNSDRFKAAIISKTAARLRTSEKCRVVICIVPAIYASYQTLCKYVSGIDVMISQAENHSIHNTEILRDKTGRETIISYAGARGAMISRIELTFDDQYERAGFASKAVFVGTAEEDYTRIMKHYKLFYT
jgi:5'-nucleotidase